MNIVKATRPEAFVCDQQAKFVQERVSLAESNVGELCSSFSQFSRKAARLRDATDEVAGALMSYSESESFNKTLKTGLSEVSKTLSQLGDFRELEVQMLDKKVVEVFSQYQGVCGRAKEELKGILGAREKELSHQRQLDRLVQRNPHNRHQIAKAEAELVKARNDVSRSQKDLEEQIDLFEKRKLKDIKTSLLDFIKIELALHAKAVELYTQAYNDMSDVDEAQDLEELKQVVANDLARLETVKRTSFRSSSLQSIANLFSTPQKTQARTPTNVSSAASKSSLDDEAVQEEFKSRIVSLRDDSDEDQQSSPFVTGLVQKHNFRT